MNKRYFDAHIKLQLKIPDYDLALFKSRINCEGAELVWLDVDAIGSKGQPRCPRCFHDTLVNQTQLGTVMHTCNRCSCEALVLTFAASDKGPYYVSIPWTE